jgi:membrane protease YdiL (CAAX protease family)
MKQLSMWAMLGIWAALCLGGTLYALWQGYGGRAFAATVSAFALLLLVMLIFAPRGTGEGWAGKFGLGGGLLLGVCVFLTYLVYMLATGVFGIERAGTMAGLIFVPLGLAVTAKGAAGAWQDFVTLTGIWVFVKFGPSHWLWPYPGGHLAYVMTVLAAVNVALAAFVLMRHVNGIGYSVGWGKNWVVYVLGSFAGFGCIAVPMGIRMHFIAFAPHVDHWRGLIFSSVAMLVFTAWPEEFLFRGLLQNMLARASKSDFAGWWTASVLFGLSHITNMGFPNWRYVFLATIAGIFYGWTWRKTGSIFASALVHAGVDVTWHFLFRT